MLDAVNKSRRLFKGYASLILKSTFSDSSVTVPLPQLKSLEKSDRVRQTAPFKKQFIENLFIKKFEETILEYPEIGSLKEIESLIQRREEANLLLVASSSVPQNALYGIEPERVMKNIKDLGLSGFKTPIKKGGFGYLNSEFAYLQEALCHDLSLSKTISENENFGVDVINVFGNKTQKEKYIGGLSKGEIMACFAHLESDNVTPLEPCDLSTKAVLSSDGKNYLVSGSKSWVYNAHHSDVIIFSANVISSPEEKNQKNITLFLIDKALNGITLHEPIKTMGLKAIETSGITFNEVLVPCNCVLGEIDKGDVPLKKLISTRELNNSIHSLSIMKKLLDLAIKHCLQKKYFKQYKCNVDYFKMKIGRIVSKIYNVESMAYLVAGRMDSFDNPDLFLESLILKIFTSESMQYIINEAFEIIGTDILSVDNSLENLINDCQFYTASDYTNSYLRFIVSTAGFKHFINYEKNLNPVSKLLSVYDVINPNNKIIDEKFILHKGNNLKGYVHPMFEKESKILENMVFRLNKCCKMLYFKYGENMLSRKTELNMITDIVIAIYSGVASLGRASRAYCLGFRNQEVDKKIIECEIVRHHVHIYETQSLIQNSMFCDNIEKIYSDKVHNDFKKIRHPALLKQ